MESVRTAKSLDSLGQSKVPVDHPSAAAKPDVSNLDRVRNRLETRILWKAMVSS